MEAAIKPKRSCKRKQYSSNPLTGVFTRNKTRRYLHHCTRSGKIRPDPVGTSDPVGIRFGMPRPDTTVSIKDLRAHRVFSDPVVVVDDACPGFDCELGGNGNPNLSGLVICGLDGGAVIEKTPNFDCELGEMEDPNLSNVGNPNFDCELCEMENPNLSNVGNPNFDCELGEMENPNFSNVGNPSFECKLGGNENPNLSVLVKCGLDVEGSVERNPNFDCELGEMENPNLSDVPNPNSNFELGATENHNLSVSFKCDSEVKFKDNEGMIEQNPNRFEKLGSGVECNDEGLNVCDFNLIEKCNSLVDLKDEGTNGQNPSLLKNNNLEVGCEKEGLDEKSSDMLEKCDSIVDFIDEGLDGQNHSLLENIDKEDCKAESLNEQSPNLLGKCDSMRGGKDKNGSVLGGDMSPNLSVKDMNGMKSEDFEGLVEISAQNTPPDAVTSMSLSLIEDSNVAGMGNVASISPHNGVNSNKDGSAEGKKTNSILKTSVMKPCSRPRVFKALNSFSYRRLLPYLMEISKDTSSPLQLDDPPKSDEKQATTMPVCCKILELSSGSNPKEEKVLSSDSHLNASTLNDPTQIPINQPNENQNSTHDEQISSDNNNKLEIAIVEECRALEVECKTKENNSITVFHKSSNVDGSVSLNAPIVGPVRGILRKNPRGCRGICDCLNCALFRVNAEKAFEFSRNQLLDTEELVQDMMKQMANLRSLLQKSVDGAEGTASMHVNQVQEACSRASDVEATARNRLSQMNEDLYIHCRNKPLQRPRVNFR